MKTIDLDMKSLPLKKLLQLAGQENVILRTSEGREFLLAAIDDFSEEVARVQSNEALMNTLQERSNERSPYTLAEVRKKLKIK